MNTEAGNSKSTRMVNNSILLAMMQFTEENYLINIKVTPILVINTDLFLHRTQSMFLNKKKFFFFNKSPIFSLKFIH